MMAPGPASSLKKKSSSLQTVTLVFRIPYYTQWGQSLLVSGSEPVLGSWNVKQGLLLSPVRQAEELVWCGKLAVASGFKCEYSYYVVDDDRKVLRWEAGRRRKLILPQGIQEGEVLEVHDLWQTGSEAIFFRSAFKSVIFAGGWNLESETASGYYHHDSQKQGSIVVQFKICCPRIEEGTMVYHERGVKKVRGRAKDLGWLNKDHLQPSGLLVDIASHFKTTSNI